MKKGEALPFKASAHTAIITALMIIFDIIGESYVFLW